MSKQTQISIEGDKIIYNGVEYQKIQKEKSPKQSKLYDILADSLEDCLMGCADITEAITDIDEIVDQLVNSVEDNWIPEFIPSPPVENSFESGWNDCIKTLNEHLR